MDALTNAAIGGLAVGLIVGVLLPWRWVVALAAVASIVFTALFIWQTPGRHPGLAVAFLFFVIVVPQVMAPLWIGSGLGIAIRTWTRDRLALRLLATVAAASAIAGLYHVLQDDPRWKQATEKQGEAFVRGHADVASRLGAVERASPNSTIRRTGDRLPFSQIEYYVRGTRGNALVVVEISGARDAPRFRVVAIKDAK